MASWVSTSERRGRTFNEDVTSGTAEETHYFQVMFDAVNATGNDATYAPGIPIRGSRLGSSNLFAFNYKVDQDKDDPRLFYVDVTYKTPQRNQQQSPPDGTGPTDKFNVEISGASVPYEVAIASDLDGQPILNAAMVPIKPPLTRVLYDEEIQVSYYVQQPEWTVLDTCRGKTNTSAVTMTINGVVRTFAAKTLKLDRTSWALVYASDGSKVVQMTLGLLYRVDGWTVLVENTSLFVNVSGRLYPITDSNGQPVSEPQYLSDDGTHILDDGDDAIILTFNIVATTDFAPLLDGIV